MRREEPARACGQPPGGGVAGVWRIPETGRLWSRPRLPCSGRSTRLCSGSRLPPSNSFRAGRAVPTPVERSPPARVSTRGGLFRRAISDRPRMARRSDSVRTARVDVLLLSLRRAAHTPRATAIEDRLARCVRSRPRGGARPQRRARFVRSGLQSCLLHVSKGYLFDIVSCLSDGALRVTLDPVGNVYVAGFTSSEDFPVRSPLQSTYAGGWDDGVRGEAESAGV